MTKAEELFDALRGISEALKVPDGEVARRTIEMAVGREDWSSTDHALLALGQLARERIAERRRARLIV